MQEQIGLLKNIYWDKQGKKNLHRGCVQKLVSADVAEPSRDSQHTTKQDPGVEKENRDRGELRGPQTRWPFRVSLAAV